MIDRLYHRFYLWAQKRQSWAKRGKDPAFRTSRHIEMVRPYLVHGGRWPEPVLVLGPRNGLELDYLNQAGMKVTDALDLFSADPRIRVGDMHAMPYRDSAFGMVWASHVLEHAREPEVVFGEIVRVLKPGGYVFVAYPTDFKVNWHDRHDYGAPILLPFRRWIFAEKTENLGTAEWAALFQV